MTIDANIVIAYLAGDQDVVDAVLSWKKEGRILFLPTVAETEVLSFSGWTPKEKRDAEEFLEDSFTSAAFDRSIARIAADIRNNTKIKFPDAAIAATAIFTHTPLVTRNQRDFKRVAGVSLVII